MVTYSLAYLHYIAMHLVCGDNKSRYWSLGFSYLSSNFIPELLFVVCIFRECWLTVASFSDFFGVYVQEGMLANVESWKK